jgi:putative ABC transport system substrate-binding protein
MAVRYAVPAVFENREFVAAGGLMSYGGSLPDAYRLAGAYVARILRGEKPGELPVQQSTKVQMFLNLKTAKALGVTVPLPLLGRADEVIE